MARRYNKPSQTASRPSERSASSYVDPHVAIGSVSVPLEQWLRSYLGGRYEDFLRWARDIEAQQWLLKAKVQEQLRMFCEAPREEDRYDPFVALGIDILARARKDLKGVKYPVPNITFSNTSSSTIVNFAAPKDAVAARRRPDVIVAPKLSDEEIARRIEEEEEEKGQSEKGKKGEEEKRKAKTTTKKTRATKGKGKKAAHSATDPEVKGCKRYWHELLQLWEFKKYSDRLLVNLEGATKMAKARARTAKVRSAKFPAMLPYEHSSRRPYLTGIEA